MNPPSPTSAQKKPALAGTTDNVAGGDNTSLRWSESSSSFDDTCLLDIDHFIKALSGVKAKGTHPDLVGSLISRYASKWLPELSGNEPGNISARMETSPESSVASWMRKRFFIERLVDILPPEKEALQCGFLLRLLRSASMVSASEACVASLESRVAARLDEATLKELMIPAFSHTCGTLLDVGLVLRLVQKFAGLDEAARSGAAMAKVARLVDGYLAEAAVDAGLTVAEFEDLGRALPSHARAIDDGLYRAIDTYMKAHPSTTKKERKALCQLIDTRKLSSEACFHAAQNERLPLRAVVQILFSEHSKLNRFTTEWSGSFSMPRSPNVSLEAPGRCSSKREVQAQHHEVRRLKDDVDRLRIQFQALQAQLDRLTDRNCKKKKKKRGFFGWSSFLSRSEDTVVKYEVYDIRKHGTPLESRRMSQELARATPRWRNSSSG